MPEARSKKVPKKLTTKTVVQKTAPKKKITKKTAAVKVSKSKAAAKSKKLQVAKKPAERIPVATKTTVKKTAVKKKTARISKVKKAPIRADATVVLPTRMSIRAREKALVWAEEFERKMHKPAYALTMTLGILFVLFGSYTGLQYTGASLVCADAQCSGQIISTGAGMSLTTADQPRPSVDLITNIPGSITSDETILIDTANTTRVSAELRFTGLLGTLQTQQITATDALNGRFRIIIPGSDLRPNQYTLRVLPYNAQGVSYGYTTLGSFTVPTDAATDSSNSSYSASSVSGSSQASSGSDGSTSATETISVSTISSTVDGITQSTTTTNIVSTIDDVTQVEETVDVVVGEDGLVTPVIPAVTGLVDQSAANEILITSPSVLSGRASISVNSPRAQLLSLYIRRLQSTEEQLVRTTYGSNFTFYLNTRDFPNGSYELSVRTTSASDDTESNSLIIRISNETEPIIPAEPETTPSLPGERQVLQITPETLGIDTPRPITITNNQPPVTTNAAITPAVADPEIAEFDPTTSTGNEAIEEPIRLRTLARLESDTDILDTLFTRYAVAVQSGDIDMIRAARNSISDYQRSVVDAALASPDDRFIADDISRSLHAEIEQITAKVETFESLRRERTEGEASKDSDGDGVTDTDERVLFGTDPLRADTDGDGFTDGAEIIKGFNPLDAASEAVITYKSPKETIGIVAKENLRVLEVVPDIALPQTEEGSISVQAVVRGKALPNSFVTLYVFSTPTIVTVRTEADGSFEYTFSKELEDGEHQVFVALTDNTGDIVAQSEPFTFIKQAEAFTAVDAEAVISDSQSSESTMFVASSFQTVLSMSVLALGILLIMLGVGLRSNRPEEVQLEVTA